VLEARERVGGRTWSGVLDGAEVDWGGEPRRELTPCP